MVLANMLGPDRPKAARERLFTKDFVLVCLFSFIVFTSFTFLLPTLPLYIKSFGGQDVEIGLAIGVFTVSAVVTRLLVGRALDVWGRKRLLVAGALAFLLAMALYARAASVPAILALRLFHGFGFAMTTSAAATLVADLAPASRRGEAMGYHGMFAIVAMAVAPGIALWLLAAPGLPLEGFALLFAMATAVAALALILTLLVRETRQPAAGRAATAGGLKLGSFFSAAALPAAGTIFFVTFTYGAIFTFLPLYAATENPQNVASFFFVYSLVVLFSRPFAGVLADRLGRRAVVIPSIVLAAVGVALLGLSAGLPVVLASAAIYGLGFGALFPGLTALAVDGVPAHQRGAALGTFMAAFDSGISIGAMAFGVVAQMAGYRLVFVLAGGCAALGLVYFVLYPRLASAR